MIFWNDFLESSFVEREESQIEEIVSAHARQFKATYFDSNPGTRAWNSFCQLINLYKELDGAMCEQRRENRVRLHMTVSMVLTGKLKTMHNLPTFQNPLLMEKLAPVNDWSIEFVKKLWKGGILKILKKNLKFKAKEWNSSWSKKLG